MNSSEQCYEVRWTAESWDAVARVICRVREACSKGELTGMLLIYVKRVFNYVSRNCLLRTMEGMSGNEALMT